MHRIKKKPNIPVKGSPMKLANPQNKKLKPNPLLTFSVPISSPSRIGRRTKKHAVKTVKKFCF